jgi:hypothetical protein
MGNVLDKSGRKNENTHFLLKPFFRKSCRLQGSVQQRGDREATDGNMVSLHALFMLDN